MANLKQKEVASQMTTESVDVHMEPIGGSVGSDQTNGGSQAEGGSSSGTGEISALEMRRQRIREGKRIITEEEEPLASTGTEEHEEPKEYSAFSTYQAKFSRLTPELMEVAYRATCDFATVSHDDYRSLSTPEAAVTAIEEQDRNVRPVLGDSPMNRSSPYNGITFYRRTGQWQAHIWHHGQQLLLGPYNTKEEAMMSFALKALTLEDTDWLPKRSLH